jgi:hypothetical protein
MQLSYNMLISVTLQFLYFKLSRVPEFEMNVLNLHSWPEKNQGLELVNCFFIAYLSNLLEAWLTSHKSIKKVFNTEIPSFMRFKFLTLWLTWQEVVWYQNWKSASTYVTLNNVFVVNFYNYQKYLYKLACLSLEGIACHNFITFSFVG